MSPTDPQAPRECGADVAAFALGALEPDEAEAMRRHLQTCAVCRHQLAEFERTVGLLALTPPRQRAPRALRRRVLAAVAAQPRGHPAHGAAIRRSARTVAPPRPTGLRLAGAAAMATAIAVTVVILAALGLASPSIATHVYTATVTGPGTAQLRVTAGHGELVVRHFSPPPTGEIYEVWVARPRHPPQPTSALFSIDSSGQGYAAVPGNLQGVSTVMVTAEPAGGTKAPTHPPVIVARLG